MQLTIDSKQLPVGWKIKKLVEVTDLITCGVAKRPDYVDDGIPFLSARNVKNGHVIWDNYKYISEETHAELTKNNKPRKGDILYTRVGSFGEAAIIDDDFEFSIFVSLTLIKTKTEILNSFLKYYLNSYSVKILAKNSISGSGVGNLNVGTVRNFFVPLPPLPEQKRIVAILDEAFEGIDRAIANTEKNLANAREIFESYLNAIFTQKDNGWEWVSLSEITTDITDGDHQPPPKSELGIPFITISNINKHNRQVDFSNTFKVSHEYFEKLKINRKPRKGDLLYTVTGSYGIPVIVDHDIDFCFQRHIGLIRPNSETNSKCLYYILLSRYLLNQADKCATGAAQKTVSLSGLRRFSVPKIPKQKQEIIVAQLDNLSEQIARLETIYSKKLVALKELKQSIMQKAFTGELTADTPKTVKEEMAA